MGIEKIGLPARPAAKGRTWVVDASSCQTCQNPFTLFNRKHHCRRCGGLFCGTCSNARVVLRGQGDTPQRVCEPCRKLEEAARFQLRNRGKHSKGVSLGSSAVDDDALLKEVGGDGLQSHPSGGSELLDGEDDEGHHGQTPKVSPSKDKSAELKEEGPEKLRERALEQKILYSTLKRDGKNAEALQAFKRHKELGREADALELSLKKLAISQRKALAEASMQRTSNDFHESAKDVGPRATVEDRDISDSLASGRKVSKDGVEKVSKDGGDDDLLKALKDLGWNEADLNEKKVKKAPTSDMELLSEIRDSLPKEASSAKPVKQNPTQLEILAHKRQALAFKRQGKPAEAKEELKKAKLLERKLEEMSLFGDDGEDDEDDDDLAVLMRSLDKEVVTGKAKDWSLPATEGDAPLSFSLDDDEETNVDVTDDDINDPSMVAALRAMGWEDEAAVMEQSRAPESAGQDAFHIAESITKQSSLQSEILTYKRRALTLKREGNLAEAKMVLQEAKVLEQRLEALKSQPTISQPISTNATVSGRLREPSKDTAVLRLEDVLEDKDDVVEVNEEDTRDPEILAALKAMGFEEEETVPPLQTLVKPSQQEKRNLQDEILSIKRSALALKKQGKTAEAREELRHAKLLEQKLQKIQAGLEANSLPPSVASSGGKTLSAQLPMPVLPLAGFVSEDEEEDVEVSADDFMDPELVAALKSVGWQEEDTFVKDEVPVKEEPAPLPESPAKAVQPYRDVKLTPKLHARKLQLQKELLAHKRRALALKREGQLEEAKVELKQGKVLEKEMEEIENAALGFNEDHEEKPIQQSKQSLPAFRTLLGDESEDEEDVTDADMQDPELMNALKSFGWKPDPENTAPVKDSNTTPVQMGPDMVEKMLDSGKKFDVENPPYKKTEPEPVSDPIWNAILNSSQKHHEVQDIGMDGESAAKPPQVVKFFPGSHGDIGSSMDMFPPLFDHPSSVTTDASVTSTHEEDFDLLSGGTWQPAVENVVEKGESEGDEDDVFDSGLLAAWQSIGMGPPSKDNSHKMSLGDGPNATGQRNSNFRGKTEAVASRRGPESDSLTFPHTGAQAEVSSALSRDGALENLASFIDPVKPVRSTSTGSTDTNKELTAPNKDNQGPVTATAVATLSLQEEIKMHKRKALALKREGKQSEAREELRTAKILEKQLDTEIIPEVNPSMDSVSKTSGAFSSTSPEKVTLTGAEKAPVKSQSVPAAVQTHKEQVRQELRHGKDRKKLQQESLAHKRKALGLRREGKTEEAEAEFELAKSLEKQMEELDGTGQAGKGVGLEAGDFGMVEDLLDPQLIAALKGLGWNDRDLHGGGLVNMAGLGAPSVSRPFEQVKLPEPQNIAGGQVSSSGANHGRAAHLNNSHPQMTGSSTPAGSLPVSAGKIHEERVLNTSNPQSQLTGGKKSTLTFASPSKTEEFIASSSQQKAPGQEKGGGGGSADKAQAQRKQLEDRIKQEKVKALELKRAGRQGEALEVLRGAKRLEKQLSYQ